jgi:hypothetical protein
LSITRILTLAEQVTELFTQVVSDLSPKNEKRKPKEKTKHEMAPSGEGASLDTYLMEEERGFSGRCK